MRGSAVVLVGGASLVLVACGHAGGDPRGRVLGELKPLEAAVPPGATNVAIHAADADWQEKCPDNPSGRSGWSAVFVSASFTTALPHEVVVTDVNATLARQGWTRHDIVNVPGQGPIAHWSKRVATGPRADAFVFPVPAGSDTWLMTASWDPPGFALPGC